MRDLGEDASTLGRLVIDGTETVIYIYINASTGDGFVKSPQCCHCEERSDAAISFFQSVTNCEIASLCSQRHVSRLFTNASQVYGFIYL
jgi:hypothetical protein